MLGFDDLNANPSLVPLAIDAMRRDPQLTAAALLELKSQPQLAALLPPDLRAFLINTLEAITAARRSG